MMFAQIVTAFIIENGLQILAYMVIASWSAREYRQAHS